MCGLRDAGCGSVDWDRERLYAVPFEAASQGGVAVAGPLAFQVRPSSLVHRHWAVMVPGLGREGTHLLLAASPRFTTPPKGVPVAPSRNPVQGPTQPARILGYPCFIRCAYIVS